MKYLIYARVSPKGSTWAATETSIPMQVAECKAYVLRQDPGAEFITREDEFFSGKDTNRPAMQTIIEEIESREANWDCLVVYHLDRLTRSLRDGVSLFDAMQKHGKLFIAIRQNFDTTTPMGRLMLYHMLSYAQFERKMTSERVLAKNNHTAQQGLSPGGKTPLGYINDNHQLKVDPETAPIVKSIFAGYLAGDSIRTLWLRYRDRIKSPQTISNIIKNKVYMGVIMYNGKEYPGKHEPLVTPEEYQQAVNRLPGKPSAPRPNAAKYDYLLTGLIRCHCGKMMSPYSVNKKGTRYFYYKCTDRACNNAINAELTDEKIWTETLKTPPDSKLVDDALAKARQAQDEKLAESKPRLKELQDTDQKS